VATPFHVIVDDALESRPRGLSAPSRGMIGALLATRPSGVEVVGFVSSSPAADRAELARQFPDLARLRTSPLRYRELAAAWRHGLVAPLGGMVHAPSLFAPLSGRREQVVVTIHDAIAWLEPDSVSGSANWYRAMGRRADRYADAVVVPSHAVASAFEERGMFRDRMHVIPGAATPSLNVPDDAAMRRARRGLPRDYIASSSTLDPRTGLHELLTALARLDAPLVLLGDPDWNGRTLEEALAAAGVDTARVTVVPDADTPDRAAILAGARLFVEPSRLEGFGANALDAMTVGTALIATADPAIVELADGAARLVDRDDVAEGLHASIGDLLEDDAAVDRLRIAGGDRARAFSWRDAAERVWQLHADL
jgi:glycosyltransferase involved in cell wall biosynthesis